MRRLLTATLVAAGVFAAVTSTAADAASMIEVNLDPERSTIGFSLGATVHTVHGTARMASGVVTLDPVSGEMSGQVVVDATTTDTDNEGRDKKMHTKVLETADHPRIVLRPERIAGTVPDSGAADVTLFAQLELVGKPHAIEIPARVARLGDQISISATFIVPYVEWGLKDPSVFVLRVEKHVTVEVEAVGTVTTVEARDATEGTMTMD